MHAFRAYIFCHGLNRLQRGLSAIAELLVKEVSDNEVVSNVKFGKQTQRQTDRHD